MSTTPITITSDIWTKQEVIAIAERMATAKQPWLDPASGMLFRGFVDNTWVREFTTPQGTARELGIREVRYVDYQPYSSKGYPSLREMRQQTRESGILLISTEGADYWFLGRDRNLRLRAIHDLHHLAEGANFSVDGETQAAVRWMRMTNVPLFRQFLFSEIIAQRCFYEVYRTYMDEQIVLPGWEDKITRLLTACETCLLGPRLAGFDQCNECINDDRIG